jgi:peptide-methionine (R)-S-oxide reductase
MTKIIKSDQQWQADLTPAQYHILRQKGTEPAFSGELLHNHQQGDYVCVGCGQVLFDSLSKFDSGSGWPSFSAPKDLQTTGLIKDSSAGMLRQEVVCTKCGSHLGHLFPDGLVATGGKRYCINAIALQFKEHKNTTE